jgi:hypothetical protein
MALAAARVGRIDVMLAKVVDYRDVRSPHPKSSQHVVQDAAFYVAIVSDDVVVGDVELGLEATVATWSVMMQDWSRA